MLTTFFLPTIFYLTPIIAATQWWPKHFTRHSWGSSTVFGNSLIFEGGLVWVKPHATPSYYTLESTVIIDLRTVWSNSTVTPIAIDKPLDYPFARVPNLFYSEEQEVLYAKGGKVFLVSEPCSDHCTTRAFSCLTGERSNVRRNVDQPVLWSVGFDAEKVEATGSWAASGVQPPRDAANLTSPLYTSTKDTFYALGGSNIANSEYMTWTAGLQQWNMNTGQWRNTSSEGYGNGGFGSFGQSLYVPKYGDEGILVFLGGYAPSESYDTWGGDTDLQPMSKITIYDIASGEFVVQETSGKAPLPRWGFCAILVEDEESESYDIFIHGGFANTQSRETYDDSFADIWALSIPSFKWTEVPGSVASMRATHNCELIGKSQMVVIGGDDPTVSAGEVRDPWANGIGVFDLQNLRWASSYDPGAPAYARSGSVAKTVRNHPAPQKWNTPELQHIFKTPPLTTTNKNNTNNHSPEPTTSNTSAKIIGGISGGTLGSLALITTLILLHHHHTSKTKTKTNKNKDTLSTLEKQNQTTSSTAELTDKTKVDAELPFQEIKSPTELTPEQKVQAELPFRELKSPLELCGDGVVEMGTGEREGSVKELDAGSVSVSRSRLREDRFGFGDESLGRFSFEGFKSRSGSGSGSDGSDGSEEVEKSVEKMV